MNDFLEVRYWDNTMQDYLIALGIIVAGCLLVKILKKTFLARIKRIAENSSTSLDDFIIEAIERFGVPALYFLLIYWGVSFLKLSPWATAVLNNATAVVITFLLIRLLSSVILFALRSYVRKQERGEEKVKQLSGLMLIINVVIWLVGLLFLFDNMGYNVTAMLTGLGIGGIAIALAAQNILGDLFNYFVIFLDRPFEVNDFVIVDDKLGVIEHIGIKTTRIKSLSGEQLVFSNSDLTSSRIHNYKHMQRRRIVFKINVVYETPLEKVKQIAPLLQKIVEEQNPVLFDRAHFAAYTESALSFEVVYYVLDGSYNVYMDVQQRINYRIYEEFNRMGVKFAHPIRTVVLKKPELAQEVSV